MTYFDKSTPKFFKSIGAGTHIKTGTMSAIKSGADGKPYLKVDFKELFVSSLQISGSSEIPTVSLSFTYNEIKIDYSMQDENGNLKSIGPGHLQHEGKQAHVRRPSHGRAFALPCRPVASLQSMRLVTS